MKIAKISANGLFGLFDHTIPLNIDERITIIHGPNGFGKTVLLKMIDGLFKQNYSIFRKIPFEEFRVDFDDGKYLLVKRISPKSHNEKVKISIQGPDLEEKPLLIDYSDFSDRRHLHFPLGVIDEVIPELDRVGSTEWLDQRTGQILTLEDVIDKYAHNLPFDFEPQKSPKWLKNIQKEIRTHFVQTNRLQPQAPFRRSIRTLGRETVPGSISAVTQYSAELAEKIQQTLAKSAELSQSLDRTFPIRLVNQVSGGKKPKLTDEKLRKELRSLEEKRERLMAAGLMDRAESDVQIPDQAAMDDLTRSVLSIYAKDGEKKLKVFDDILSKIGLLQNIINTRYSYSFKRLRIDKNQGFIFETRDGIPIPGDALSSGEQHELVLVYELLFRIQPGSFILIDEPEISLHIGWQQVFLKDLMAITGLANIDVLIATHSADIIYDKWNLTVELKGPSENETSL